MVFTDIKSPGDLIKSSDWNDFITFSKIISGNCFGFSSNASNLFSDISHIHIQYADSSNISSRFPASGVGTRWEELTNGGNTSLHKHNFISGNAISSNIISYNRQEWNGGNVTYVPINGNIATYISNASSGDTLILSTGTYTITSSIIVSKSINIIGQGINSTIINCNSDGIVGFLINASDVNISNLSITSTNSYIIGFNIIKDLDDIIISDIDINLNGTAGQLAFEINASNVILRDVTFDLTAGDYAYGIYIHNDVSSTQNSLVSCYSIIGTTTGTVNYSIPFKIYNNNSSFTITMDLINCKGYAGGGTTEDYGLSLTSLTTNNGIVNVYNSIFSGIDYDIYKEGTNTLNLYNCTLVNKTYVGEINVISSYNPNIKSTSVSSSSISGQWYSPIYRGSSHPVASVSNERQIIITSGSGTDKSYVWICLRNSAGNYNWFSVAESD
jgi:hypothetical protein